MIAVALSGPRPAAAHPVPFSYLDLRLGSDAISGSLVVHVSDAAHDLAIEPAERLIDPDFAAQQSAALANLLAARFTVSADGRALAPQWSAVKVLTGRQSLKLPFRFALDGRPGRLSVSADLFPYDPRHQTFLNIYEGDELTQAILDRSRTGFESFAGTRRGSFAVVQKFLPAGIHHILIGPDHVLFLVGLLLLGGTIRRLALIVTGFTVAHSITLSLAALDLVTPPARIIEPAIALSIIFVGADNLLVKTSAGARDVRAWIAFAFGFIHGFGFANVLREMDLPPRALGGRCSRSTSAWKSVSSWSWAWWPRRLRRCARGTRPRDDSSPLPDPSPSWRRARSGSSSGSFFLEGCHETGTGARVAARDGRAGGGQGAVALAGCAEGDRGREGQG